MKYLSSKNNDLIKKISKLKNKKQREKEKLFLIEGEKSVAEALQKQNFLAGVFFKDSCPQYLEWFKYAPDIEWYQLAEGLFDYLSDTKTPQGILALARIPHYDPAAIPAGKLLVCLDGISDPGNIGAIIRTGWAMEADGILMTKDCADPFSPKVVRASMGGILNIPVYRDYSLGKLRILQNKGYSVYGSSLETANSLYEQDLTGGIVVVIGNESRGISEDSVNICDKLLKIPINPQVDSLNAGAACAIILAEAWQQRHRNS